MTEAALTEAEQDSRNYRRSLVETEYMLFGIVLGTLILSTVLFGVFFN